MNDTQHNSWIYGVVPAGASLKELEQRQGLPEVWLVETGDLAAIVGDQPPQDANATREQAIIHARVLEAAIVDSPVVPFRFGTVVSGGDEEVGKELLKGYHDQLSQLLARFEDYVQMTLKASYHDDVVLQEIIESQPEIAQLREQARGDEDLTRAVRVRLGELINAALEQTRARDANSILEELKPETSAVAPDPLETEFMVLNAPFLVKRGRVEEFEEAVERIADDHLERMHFTLLGPMPAFSFVDVQEPAWASSAS
jgi:Gas vesicle synthesis protein GvpL/GvpF